MLSWHYNLHHCTVLNFLFFSHNLKIFFDKILIYIQIMYFIDDILIKLPIVCVDTNDQNHPPILSFFTSQYALQGRRKVWKSGGGKPVVMWWAWSAPPVEIGLADLSKSGGWGPHLSPRFRRPCTAAVNDERPLTFESIKTKHVHVGPCT